jgi:aryl-alcohol dehydrogenase-like predicted oxidoreductase
MKRRKVGTSALEVSEIAVGTGDNAGCFVYGSPDEQRAMVIRALELGVNTFDCSPDYGKGLGEANLGRVFKQLGVSDAVVITKVEIMPEDFGRIRDKVRESVNDSLLRLGRDAIEIVMLHNPCRRERIPSIRQWTPLTPADVLDEVLPAFSALRSTGKVRYFGLACEAAETAAVRQVLATREFTLINAWYNLTNPSASRAIGGLPERERYDGLFGAATEFGAGIAVIRPLAGGALTGPILERSHAGRHDLSRGYLRDQPQVFEPELDRARHFSFLHRPGDQTISAAAYRYILATTCVSTVVGGFSEISHLEEAAWAADRGPLSKADAERIAAAHATGF